MMNLAMTWNNAKNVVEMDVRTAIYECDARGFAMHTSNGWIATVDVYPYVEDYSPAPIFTGECKRAASANEALRKACYQIAHASYDAHNKEVHALMREVRKALK